MCSGEAIERIYLIFTVGSGPSVADVQDAEAEYQFCVTSKYVRL
jgi:hypothetical protein